MPRVSKPAVEGHQVRGLQHLRQIFSLLQFLHDDATVRDKAHNRTLFFDQYAALVLMSLFSPAVDSLRAIIQATAMPKVRKLLGCSKVSLGSLSEAARVFDPQLLLDVIAELSKELLPLVKDPRLKDIQTTLTLCDGTLLSALPRLAESMWLNSRSGNPQHAWRMHTQFELDRHVPTDVRLTPYRCQGDEPAVLLSSLQSGRCYVMDRGYFCYDLLNGIIAAGSDYVCRVKKSIGIVQVIEQRPLTDSDRAAGVVSDQVIDAGSTRRQHANHRLRLIEVHAQVQPRTARGEAKAHAQPATEVLLIATNLLDVPAEIIALIYRYRWTIELFFRFFKQILGCRHLLSQRAEGIQIQMYCAVIACMLINLWTGRRPGKQMVNMLAWYFMGVATAAEVRAFLDEPDNTGIKRRAKDELWKKLGY
jgi:hypothetical protein